MFAFIIMSNQNIIERKMPFHYAVGFEEKPCCSFIVVSYFVGRINRNALHWYIFLQKKYKPMHFCFIYLQSIYIHITCMCGWVYEIIWSFYDSWKYWFPGNNQSAMIEIFSEYVCRYVCFKWKFSSISSASIYIQCTLYEICS